MARYTDGRFADPAQVASGRYDMNLQSMKPFMWIERHVHIPITDKDAPKGVTMGILAFGAYNAFGLIGPEKGGVAIVIEEPERATVATRDIPYSMARRDIEVDRLLRAVARATFAPGNALLRTVKESSEYGFRYDVKI